MSFWDDIKNKASDKWDNLTTDDVRDGASDVWSFYKSENSAPPPEQQQQPKAVPAPPKQSNNFNGDKTAKESVIVPNGILGKIDTKYLIGGVAAAIIAVLFMFKR